MNLSLTLNFTSFEEMQEFIQKMTSSEPKETTKKSSENESNSRDETTSTTPTETKPPVTRFAPTYDANFRLANDLMSQAAVQKRLEKAAELKKFDDSHLNQNLKYAENGPVYKPDPAKVKVEEGGTNPGTKAEAKTESKSETKPDYTKKPASKAKGVKKLSPQSELDDEDIVSSISVKDLKEKLDHEEVELPSKEEAIMALGKVNSTLGMPAARNVLKHFGASRLSEIDKSVYPDFIKKCNAVISSEHP